MILYILKNLKIPTKNYCLLSLSRVQLFVTPQTVARQASLSMGILQARIPKRVAMPPRGDLLNPGIKPRSPALRVDSLPAELPGSTFLYIEKPKDSNKKLFELVNKFHEVAGYKINMQKSVAFLYTNNELSETLRKSCFQLHQKIKHLGINLMKKVRDFMLKLKRH